MLLLTCVRCQVSIALLAYCTLPQPLSEHCRCLWAHSPAVQCLRCRWSLPPTCQLAGRRLLGCERQPAEQHDSPQLAPGFTPADTQS